MDGGVVEFVVEDGSAPIFNGVFDCRYGENDNERYGVQGGVAGAKNRKDLYIKMVSLNLVEAKAVSSGELGMREVGEGGTWHIHPE